MTLPKLSTPTYELVVPSTGKDPVKVDNGASPMVLKIVLTASSSVVLVVIVIKVKGCQKNYQLYLLIF